MANVVVTGANGFIGRVLTKALLDAGHEVIGTVRSPESIDTKVSYKQAVTGELDGSTSWRGLLEGSDVVIHLAARTSRGVGADNAALERINAHATERLAHETAAAGLRRLIYLSSIKVNGERTYERPFTASDRPAPEDAYALSKLRAEQALERAARATGLEIVVVRPPLVYGPGVKGNFLRLMRQIDRSLPLPLASINNRRSLIALDNLVDFLLICTHHTSAAGKTFLISDGEDLSTPALACEIASAMARSFRLWPVPPRLLEVLARAIGRRVWFDSLCGSLQVDAGPAREWLGWRPRVSATEALLRTVEWYQKSRDGSQRL